LLAKNPPSPRLFRKHALSLTFIASKLAPTKDNNAECQLLGNCSVYQHLRFFHQLLEVFFADKALGVDLVDVLGT